MHPDHGEAKKKFADEIAVAHGVDAVLGHARKTELASNEFAIEHDCRSSECSGTKREDISSNQTVAQPFYVAFECLHLSQHVMRKGDWLCALQVRVPGHYHIEMLFGEIEEGSL